ncbi:MAG: deoxyguanosinetriphosphate triphosphohydrolase [Verrucomicrobiota bacterium]
MEVSLRDRRSLELEEAAKLGPYAVRSADSAGREYEEPEHPFRTAFQRDRARIIHSRAFRRLAHKTQVFLGDQGDHLRSRLTHTIEVASVGRTLASALRANEDLVECISLAHDLGHAPLGHRGEECLNELMADHGGFEHNQQSLRIVQEMERKYPEFPGLNLSAEVCDGLRKHQLREGRLPSLESQLADIADEITYYSHDLDDGLDFGLITGEDLERLELWQVCARRIRTQFPSLEGERFRRYVIRSLIDFEVADVIASTRRRIEESGVSSVEEICAYEEKLVTYGERVRQANRELREVLFQSVYRHSSVEEVSQRGCAKIRELFYRYSSDPEQMGGFYEDHRESCELPRLVTDFLSGMTDRFLHREFRRLG